MRRLLLLEHVSLDGYLAGPNGDMSWIRVDADQFAYGNAIFKDADTAIFGHTTYDMMAGYWPTAADQPEASAHDREHANWLNSATIVVVSRKLQQPPPWGGTSKSIALVDNIQSIAALKAESGKAMVLIGSASVARECVSQDLVDEFWLYINPVILGAGESLFGARRGPATLELQTTTPFPNGVVAIRYQPNNASQ